MVKIRLQKFGRTHYPQFRVVVMDSRKARDAKIIENIGVYNPNLDPSFIEIDSSRVQHWLKVGAQPSEAVKKQLTLTGDWDKFKGKSSSNKVKKSKPKISAEKKVIKIDKLIKESIENYIPKKDKISDKNESQNQNAEEKPKETESKEQLEDKSELDEQLKQRVDNKSSENNEKRKESNEQKKEGE